MFNKQKAFGQNFLIDHKIIHFLVKSIENHIALKKIDLLVEIGPGKGAITLPVLQKIPSHLPFWVIEKDHSLVTQLQPWQNQFSHFRVFEMDAVDLEESFFQNASVFLFSNLPYSCAAKIITKIATIPSIDGGIFMFPSEMAQRILNFQTSRLGVFLQNIFHVKHLLNVSPKSFSPIPKIFSDILEFKKKATLSVPMHANELEYWEHLLQKAYFAPRKMLRSKLSSVLQEAQVDGTKRAEQLDWAEWNRLFNVYKKQG